MGGQGWSEEGWNGGSGSEGPHFIVWLSPQLLVHPLPSHPPAWLPPLFQALPEKQPSEGPGARDTWAHSVSRGSVACRHWDLKPNRPRQRSSSWAGSSASWKPVAVGRREEDRVLSLESQPSPPPPKLWLGSHLSFGHFFDGLDPLGGLVSHILLRNLCPGICLVRARP